MNDTERIYREQAQKALGKRYAQRLMSAYAVLIDGEGLFKFIAQDGNFGSAYSSVCRAFRDLREKANLDF